MHRPLKHRIGEIVIDDNGLWWVQWTGTHAEQGGYAFTKGNLGSDDLVGLLKGVAENMISNKDNYMTLIKAKANKD